MERKRVIRVKKESLFSDPSDKNLMFKVYKLMSKLKGKK